MQEYKKIIVKTALKNGSNTPSFFFNELQFNDSNILFNFSMSYYQTMPTKSSYKKQIFAKTCLLICDSKINSKDIEAEKDSIIEIGKGAYKYAAQRGY